VPPSRDPAAPPPALTVAARPPQIKHIARPDQLRTSPPRKPSLGANVLLREDPETPHGGAPPRAPSLFPTPLPLLQRAQRRAPKPPYARPLSSPAPYAFPRR
jgi:hypothetical protein